ncbi:hypothetical protein KC19_10G106900 [Ceratodon purpureus]|uniref:Uncharacterized protein n=1 Tax=Ceratodon purpureus TaxID=3225 RepID=A0A8T0GR56_CERPU|nr:hypothetical protein KC19_10G106900 [Ceratodon purpureus]
MPPHQRSPRCLEITPTTIVCILIGLSRSFASFVTFSLRNLNPTLSELPFAQLQLIVGCTSSSACFLEPNQVKILRNSTVKQAPQTPPGAACGELEHEILMTE